MKNKNKKIIIGSLAGIGCLAIGGAFYATVYCLADMALSYNATPYILEVPKHRTIKTEAVKPVSASMVSHEAPKTAYTIRGVKLNDAQMVKATKIIEIAKRENFEYIPYLLELSYCESRLGEIQINDKGNTPPSRDRGLFQINDYWHKDITDAQAFDLEFATKWTIKMINNGYQKRWACDKIVRSNDIKIVIN